VPHTKDSIIIFPKRLAKRRAPRKKIRTQCQSKLINAMNVKDDVDKLSSPRIVHNAISGSATTVTKNYTPKANVAHTNATISHQTRMARRLSLSLAKNARKPRMKLVWNVCALNVNSIFAQIVTNGSTKRANVRVTSVTTGDAPSLPTTKPPNRA